MAVTIPPIDVAQGTSAPGTPEQPITAFRARQLVNVLMTMEVSSQMLAQAPELVHRERPCWSVPVWFTLPGVGLVGQAGTVLVDAHTGEVLADSESLREIAMAVTIPPVDVAQGASAPGTPELPITAFRALQIVNVLVKMEVSTQLGASDPTLAGEERACWSVPVWLSFPDCGRVGQAGTVLVDAHTGDVLAEAETLREIAKNATRLPRRPAR